MKFILYSPVMIVVVIGCGYPLLYAIFYLVKKVQLDEIYK